MVYFKTYLRSLCILQINFSRKIVQFYTKKAKLSTQILFQNTYIFTYWLVITKIEGPGYLCPERGLYI
jgi:hypothetical protein